MGKKAAAKKTAKKAAPVKSARNPNWPEYVEGCAVIGETADGTHWIVRGTEGTRHVTK